MLIVSLALIVAPFVAHHHFAPHAEEFAAGQADEEAKRDQIAQAASDATAARALAQHNAEVKANHERRLLWQRAHPAEYAAQLADAKRKAQEAIDAKRRQEAEEARQQRLAQEQQERQQAPAAAEQQREADQPKPDEISNADSSITAAAIAGNPEKYVNAIVKLKCKISNVGADVGANAVCGSISGDTDDFSDTLLLTGDDVSSYDANQIIRFVRTVQEPVDGSNAMGEEMHFPTVKVDCSL